MLKVLTVFGTRPEAIKMAPVIRELERRPELFRSVVCVTGQHRELLDQVLEVFEIRPQYNLAVMQSAQDLFDITCRVLQLLRPVLEKERPDLVLVHGDTSTTMAASLAAYYCRIPVAHVEAGLRTHDKHAPFPEEMNRRITGAVGDLHFAPTSEARQNLLREGVPAETVFVTGNTVVDALLRVSEKIDSDQQLRARLAGSFSYLDKEKKLILVTGHRRENFGPGLERICFALKELAAGHPDVEICYPVHLNPAVREPVQGILGGAKLKNVHLAEPLDYLSFVYLMKRCYLVITDSGGIQEEAPALGKPVLLTRETTERPEALQAGTVRLVGTDTATLLREAEVLLCDGDAYRVMSLAHSPYGDGNSAARIAEQLAQLAR